MPARAVALPAPISLLPQAAIACFIVFVPEIFDFGHLPSAFTLTLKSLSRYSRARSVYWLFASL